MAFISLFISCCIIAVGVGGFGSMNRTVGDVMEKFGIGGLNAPGYFVLFLILFVLSAGTWLLLQVVSVLPSQSAAPSKE